MHACIRNYHCGSSILRHRHHAGGAPSGAAGADPARNAIVDAGSPDLEAMQRQRENAQLVSPNCRQVICAQSRLSVDPLDTRGDDKFVVCHCQRVIHLFKTDWSPPAPAASTSARHAAWGRAAANAGASSSTDRLQHRCQPEDAHACYNVEHDAHGTRGDDSVALYIAAHRDGDDAMIQRW